MSMTSSFGANYVDTLDTSLEAISKEKLERQHE
jgi:hypothetical protein